MRAANERTGLLAACAAVLVAAGLGLALPSGSVAAAEGTVTHDVAARLVGDPLACQASSVGRLLVRIARAITSGQTAVLDRSFARAPQFRWYSDASSSTKRLEANSQNRATLLRYFADRRRHGERMRFLQIRSSVAPTGEIANVSWIIERRARDLPTHLPFTVGKAAVSCMTAQVVVWSLGDPRLTSGASICPGSRIDRFTLCSDVRS
jgi:hypothetical protein